MVPAGLIINLVVALALFVFWVVSFIILYHLSRFGVGVQPKRFAGIFLVGAIILFSINLILYIGVDVEGVISLI